MIKAVFAMIGCLSLLSAGADAVFWVRGERGGLDRCWKADCWEYQAPRWRIEIRSDDGKIHVARFFGKYKMHPTLGSRWTWDLKLTSQYSFSQREPGAPWTHRLGLFPPRVRQSWWDVLIPQWLLWPMLATPGQAWMMRLWLAARRCAKRRAGGLCVRCGYDLRATSDRCPECATIPGPHRGRDAQAGKGVVLQ